MHYSIPIRPREHGELSGSSGFELGFLGNTTPGLVRPLVRALDLVTGVDLLYYYFNILFGVLIHT
jgi:hypothetical protein